MLTHIYYNLLNYHVVIKNMGCWTRLTSIGSQFWHSDAVRPWTSHLTSLSPSFLICKMRRLNKLVYRNIFELCLKHEYQVILLLIFL